MAKVYKMVVLVIDFEGMREADVVQTMERNRYLSIEVCDTQSRTVEWNDDHPLNKRDTSRAAFDELFADAPKEPAAQGGVPEAVAAVRIKIDYTPKIVGAERGWLEVVAEEFTIPGVSGHRFAVHNTVDHVGEYTATHLATGFAVARGESPDYAIELARKNWLTCDPESLALKMIRAKNQTKVRAAAPTGASK